MAEDHHALVFGASGVTGWSIVDSILRGYPTPETFRRVTALTNRPLSPEAAQWPSSEKLKLVSGIDLLQDSHSCGERVPDIETVTEVYFFAYAMDPNPEIETKKNEQILRQGVAAVDSLSPKLRFVLLGTGVKEYGIHLLDKFPWGHKLPLKETHPPLPEPYRSELFYYPQLEVLSHLAQGKRWKHCRVLPDIIVGFVPNNNFYSLAQWLAMFLSLYREINGEGATVVFPGTMKSWKALSQDSSQDLIARFSIYASLDPHIGVGERYNIADSEEPTTWEVKWPIVCEYFGLKGASPEGGSGPDPARYIAENNSRWAEMEEKYNLQKGHGQSNDRSLSMVPHFLMSASDFDRPLDMTKTHQAWGPSKEEADVRQCWYTAFDRYRRAKIIP
ncbi:hypothetical protein N7470_002953 [Penicillium chermesinum]|nr:hypothetical protein N7470_002953 [Penicillium chermesinum]